MGQITAPFGIKGWIKLQPFTAAPENLQAYSHWWIGSEGAWQEYRVEGMQVNSAAVVVKLAGCEDRDAAALFRGREIAVPRDALPETAANEFYWSDLVGLKVVNAENEDLGTVSEVFATGANDVLVVQGDRERLIPFTEEVVKRVDLAGGVIRVDWGRDY
ncbi:MAG TPA: ribosome maturation factor RimM [Burkholderiales bacterium]|nr:ribosome maturation factor RimM [Burkholderiales bacterium]